MHTPLKHRVPAGQQNAPPPLPPPPLPPPEHIRSGGQQPPMIVRTTPPLVQHCSVLGSHSPVTQQVEPQAEAAEQQPLGPLSPLGAYTWPWGQQTPPFLAPARAEGQHSPLTSAEPCGQAGDVSRREVARRRPAGAGAGTAAQGGAEGKSLAIAPGSCLYSGGGGW